MNIYSILKISRISCLGFTLLKEMYSLEMIRTQNALIDEIHNLISKKQDGDYWIVKKRWYDNDFALLHDIICLANNLCNHEAYIVIGVDPENDYTLIGTDHNGNRRNTQAIVRLLKGMPFAGGFRPVVHVEQICMDSHMIDVIVIDSSHNTPFFLTEQAGDLHANHVYTRVMDINTPIDKTADLAQLELLWRKRFYLDSTPSEQFVHYLSQPHEWERIPDSPMGYYYKYAPEFILTREKNESLKRYDYYLFGQINLTPSWWDVTLKYHQTTLNRFLGIALDGGNCFVIAPYSEINLSSAGLSFAYFTDNSLESILLEFFHLKETVEERSFRIFMDVILRFASESEHRCFVEYVRRNLSLFQKLYLSHGEADLPFFPSINGMTSEEYKCSYKDAIVMKEMLRQFRLQEGNC